MTFTTLITFLLQAPVTTRSVDLLGSWDNFSRTYPLQRDLRIGTDHWRGCHTFKNIICDGESPVAAVGRDGGLKMGETYWYYYRLNDDTDYHDPARPFTTYCPFLPGQPINILDVPMQSSQPDSSIGEVQSSLDKSANFTMNPEDKFLTPKPVVVPVEPQLSRDPNPMTVASIPRTSKLFKRKSFPAKESSARRPASAPSSLQSMSDSWSEAEGMTRSFSLYSLIMCHKGRGLQCVGRSRSHRTRGRPTLWINPNLPILRSSARPKSSCSSPLSASMATKSEPLVVCLQEINKSSDVASISPSTSVNILAHGQQMSQTPSPNNSASSSCSNVQLLQYACDKSRSAQVMPLAPFGLPLLGRVQEPSALTILRNSESQLSKTTDFASLANPSYDIYDTMSQDHLLRRTSSAELSSSQNRRCQFQDIQNTHHASPSIQSTCIGGDVFTPSLTISTIDTGLMSPFRLADTNVISPTDFEHVSPGPFSPRNNFESNKPYGNTYGLQDHTHPTDTNKSVLTLPASPPTIDRNGAGVTLQQASEIRVQAWNDGSAQATFDMSESFDDLSYLGAMIV